MAQWRDRIWAELWIIGQLLYNLPGDINTDYRHFAKRWTLCGVPDANFSKIQRKYYLSLTLVTHWTSMILSFKNKDTEKIWEDIRVKKLPLNIQEIGRRKLRMLHNAQDLNDLKIPPANRLEKLSGKPKDFYSIRINNQWRIIFKWKVGNASEVEILDYH